MPHASSSRPRFHAAVCLLAISILMRLSCAQHPAPGQCRMEAPINQYNIVERYHLAYKEYQNHINMLKSHAWKCSLMGQSSEMELEMTYMRIRMTQPDLVYELSPNYGFSTIFILWALHDNHKGRLYSFDTHERYHKAANCIVDSNLIAMASELDHGQQQLSRLSEFALTRAEAGNALILAGNIVGGGRFNFVLGDVLQTFDQTVAVTGLPNMLFLDSAHSREMAIWYTDHVFPMFSGRHTYVSVHEVHNPTFWNDQDLFANKERDLEMRPAWMATEEGLAITDWLLYQPYACGIHSMALSRWPAIYQAMNDMRTQIFGADLRHPAAGLRPHIQENPTLFFELNCPELCPGIG